MYKIFYANAPLWEAIDRYPKWQYNQRVNIENIIWTEGNGLCFLLKYVKIFVIIFPRGGGGGGNPGAHKPAVPLTLF